MPRRRKLSKGCDSCARRDNGKRQLFGQRGSIEAGGAAEHGALAVAGERDGSGGGDARGLAFEQISGEAGGDEVARRYRL